MICIAGFARAGAVLRELAGLLEERGHRVARCPDDRALRDWPAWTEAEMLVAVGVPCGAPEMDAAPRLAGIVSPVIGYDWIDVNAATARGIVVANGPVRQIEESMAEATIMLVLVALYELHATERLLRANPPPPPPQRRMLSGRTLGIVGFGRIAKAVIRRLEGWDVDLLVASSHAQAHPGVRFVDLDMLLGASDVVLLLSSLTARTHHLLDAARIARMRRGAILVNTARGGLVDEDALVAALASGQIGKAMLDVFAVEPLPAESPLRTLDNVVLTPHAVGHTAEIAAAIPRAAADTVAALLAGTRPGSCVNCDALAAAGRSPGRRP